MERIGFASPSLQGHGPPRRVDQGRAVCKPTWGGKDSSSVDTLRSNKMMFENNHAYQRGQEDQNKILADHFIYFLNIDVVLAHL